MNKITYTLNHDDCKDYARYLHKVPKIKKMMMRSHGLMFLAIGVCFTICILSSLESYTWESVSNNLLLIISLILVYIAICTFCWMSSKYDLMGLSSSAIFKALSGQSLDMEMNILDDGIETSNKCGSGLLKWDGIKAIYQSKKSIFVFIGDYKAYIVPKRAFESEEKAQEFFNFVKERIGNN